MNGGSVRRRNQGHFNRMESQIVNAAHMSLPSVKPDQEAETAAAAGGKCRNLFGIEERDHNGQSI